MTIEPWFPVFYSAMAAVVFIAASAADALVGNDGLRLSDLATNAACAALWLPLLVCIAAIAGFAIILVGVGLVERAVKRHDRTLLRRRRPRGEG